MDNNLREAVTEKNNWTFTESKLQELVDKFLVIHDLSQLSSLLCEILVECTSNPYALYKTTIVMKHMCERNPTEFSSLLLEKKNILESIKTYSYIDFYRTDQGSNVRNNIQQLLDFIEFKKKFEHNAKGGIICTAQNKLDATVDDLQQILNSITGVKSKDILQDLRSTIALLNNYLPGAVTPEKYAGLDKSPRLDGVIYGKLVESIVDKFDDNWPMIENSLDPIVERLIVLDGMTFDMLHESLIVLTDSLKISTNGTVMNSIVLLLEKLIKSEALLSAITQVCRSNEETTMEREETETRWQSMLQIIISLPNRIANKLGIKVFESFLPETFATIVSVHIARAILFLNSCRSKLDIKLRTNMLSMLISKCVIVLGSRRFENLFDVMSAWCHKNSDNIRECTNSILGSIDGPAVQSIAVYFLRNCKTITGVENVFGNLLDNANWKHVFTVKVPLMCYYNDENLMVNLIGYLSKASLFNNERILPNLLIRLLDIWGDRSALNHTSLEQHEYITKLIIISVRKVKESLETKEKDTARRLLFSGTSAHLESTQAEIRAIGMITGEILVEMLNDSNDAPKLKYDYDGIPEVARKIVENLRNIGALEERLTESTLKDERLTAGSIIFSDVGQREIYELGIKCGIIVDDTSTVLMPIEKETIKLETKQQSIDRVQLSSNDDDDDDADLDSDDDLVAYDMSNDTSISTKLRPTYLRDLKENLLNAQSNTDPNIFAESMNAAEELIISQLPNDDTSFGMELLDILVSLRENSYVENFALLKFNACVAIVVVCPKDGANYLSNKFHTKISDYSINDRLFMLDVLSESARRISKIEIKQTVEMAIERKKPIARKAISLMIDTNNTKKYETLYDDDFEVSSTDKESRTDWKEIVNARIQSNTRRLNHPSKKPLTTINRFNDVAASFFYPLLYGFRKKGTCMSNTPKSFEDQENILLVHYLKALSTIMMSAENCILVPNMAKEMLDLAWSLRYHTQAKVRLCVIENTASVVITLRKEDLTAELMEMIYEFRAWLSDVSDDGIRGDPDSNCRNLGKNVVALIDSIFYSTLNEL